MGVSSAARGGETDCEDQDYLNGQGSVYDDSPHELQIHLEGVRYPFEYET